LMQLLPARWHLPLLLTAVAIALATALSRIVLHVHYASDVMAGIASGSAWLTLCITVAALLRRRSVSSMQPSGRRNA
jgi:membrane-associated phospholipid phosphatase